MPTDSISEKEHEDTDLVSIYSADENLWHNDNVFFDAARCQHSIWTTKLSNSY